MVGYAYVLCAAIMWGLIGPLSKLSFAAGMDTVEVAFWRTSLAWLFFAAQAVKNRETRIAARDLPAVAGFGVAGIAGLFGTYVVAVAAGGAALASVLLYTAPAWVALMSRLFLKEPMGGFKVAAVAATILGVAGVSLGPGDAGGPVIGLRAVTFGLLSGITYALYYIFGKYYLGRYKTPTLFLYALPVGSLTLLPFVHFTRPTLAGALPCLVLAVVSTYASYSIYYAGLKRLEATRASVVATMEPVMAALLAYFMFGECFSPLGYAGSALIIGSVLLTIWDGARERLRAPLPAGPAGNAPGLPDRDSRREPAKPA
jgi:DME family drug/metabolite transporter